MDRGSRFPPCSRCLNRAVAQDARELLSAAIEHWNVQAEEHNRKNAEQKWRQEPVPPGAAEAILNWLETGKVASGDGKYAPNSRLVAIANNPKAAALVRKLLAGLDVAQLCRAAASNLQTHQHSNVLEFVLQNQTYGASLAPPLNNWLSNGGDFRLIAKLIERYGNVPAASSIRLHLQSDWMYYNLKDAPGRSLWPYFAENFEALDAGFGMKVWHGVPTQQIYGQSATPLAVRAIEILKHFPRRRPGICLHCWNWPPATASGTVRAQKTCSPRHTASTVTLWVC